MILRRMRNALVPTVRNGLSEQRLCLLPYALDNFTGWIGASEAS